VHIRLLLFLPLFRHHHHMLVPSNVTSASADCSSSINAPHEYFDRTRCR
jgi:hypothetical protein